MKTRTHYRVCVLIILLIASSPISVTRSANEEGIRGTYIYDRAEVIEDAWRDRIHNHLLRLDENTTAEIVIFTLSSLTGHGIKDRQGSEITDIELLAYHIFNKLPLEMPTKTGTGIGKEGKDNGLLILVTGFADDDIQGKIETGIGMEAVLPDLKLYQIVQDCELVPRLEGGEVGEAIYDFVKAVSEIIYEDFVQTQPEDTESETDPTTGRSGFLVIIGAVLLLLACLIGVFYIIPGLNKILRQWAEKKRRIAEVKKAIIDHEDDDEEIKKEIDRLKKKTSDYPEWARLEAEDKILTIEHRTQLVMAWTQSAKESIEVEEDVDSAEKEIQEVEYEKRQIVQLITFVDSTLPKKIAEYREGAPKKLNLAENKQKEVEKLVTELQHRGYKVGPQIVSIKNIGRDIAHLDGLLKGDDVNHRDVFENAESAYEKAVGIERSIRSRLMKQKEVNSSVETLTRSIDRARKGVPKAKSEIERMYTKHPKKVLETESRNILKVPGIISSVERLLSEAVKLNSMELQQFEKAAEKVYQARMEINSAQQFVDAVFEKREELHRAKNDAPGLLDVANSFVPHALETVRHSDVSQSTERIAEEAESNLSRAKRMYDRSHSGTTVFMDWLMIVALLTAAISLSKKAVDKAEDEIYQARRRRESEEKRRREEEEERYWSSRRSSYERSSPSSGSSGTVFGGGGGRSRGGGIKF